MKRLRRIGHIRFMTTTPSVPLPPAGVLFEIDVRLWPLVLIKVPPVLTAPELDYAEDAYGAVLTAAGRHAAIIDTTSSDRVPGAVLRQRMREFEARQHGNIRKRNLGTAVVTRSAIARGAITAVRWISPAASREGCFTSVRDAARWCVNLLELDGVRVPDAAYLLAGTLRPKPH